MSADPTNSELTENGEPDEHEDLGFGRLVSQSVRGRFLSRDGAPQSRKFGEMSIERPPRRQSAATFPLFEQ